MSEHNSNQNESNVESAPAWLNEEFFVKVLKKSENTTNIELVGFELVPALNKNEHYASVLYRASVQYRLQAEFKCRKMIVKAMLEKEGSQKELFKDSTIFETETAMYSSVIPKFEAILKQAGDETKLGPRMLYYELEPKQVIVFEDLVQLGYEVRNDRALNFAETKAVYEKIAKWHAISYKINLEQPEFFKPFHQDNVGGMNLKDNPAFNDGIFNFIELLESQPDLAHYKPYFESYRGTILTYWEKASGEFLYDRQELSYYVLCHGDFHHKNMMFRYNYNDCVNGHIEDLLLLDFQMCYMGPIVNDLICSTYMIMDGEQRLQNFDELLNFYFNTFKNTLEKIGFNGTMPIMSELRKQMTRHKGYELFLLTNFLPVLMAIDDKTYDIAQMMNDAKLRKEIFKNPEYIKQVREILPKYLQKGYFEIDEDVKAA